MPTIKQVLDLARSQIGTTEYPPNSNTCVYNQAFYGHPVQDGIPDKKSKYPWCAVFVWWCFAPFDPCLVKKTASCQELGNWFKERGQWVEPGDQRFGDVAFYKFNTNERWTNHTGIVDEVVGPNDIFAIEGNTSEKGSQDNGGAVLRKHRTSNIVGYGRPLYSDYAEIAPVQREYIYGLDVSKYQPSVDFNKVKLAGFQFVILRATTKSGAPDVKFEEYYNGAKEAEMRIAGVYKLSYAHSSWEARREAEDVIKLLGDRKCDIWLDMENDGGQQIYSIDIIAAIITEFLTTCVEAGFDVGIYCNLDWYNNHIRDDIKKICRFWIARYPKEENDDGTVHENLHPHIKNAIYWQYSSKGHIPGIPGDVDLDVKL